MCAILDANAASEVFSSSRSTAAGTLFLDWIKAGKGRLVIGGKLTEELSAVSEADEWLKQASLAELTRDIGADEIKAEEEKLQNKCKSNDPHIIALARISGARLLYSHDTTLHKDFKNGELIDQPRGKIYSDDSHQTLLKQRGLCRPRQ